MMSFADHRPRPWHQMAFPVSSLKSTAADPDKVQGICAVGFANTTCLPCRCERVRNAPDTTVSSFSDHDKVDRPKVGHWGPRGDSCMSSASSFSSKVITAQDHAEGGCRVTTLCGLFLKASGSYNIRACMDTGSLVALAARAQE